MRHDAEIRELLHKRRDGHTLPQAFYTDTDLFEFDLRAVFHRLWIFAGLEAELHQPGDWFTLDIAATSVVVLRDRDGRVRAFFNTCRHRGSRICSGESGQAIRLVCPYHQWTYDLDGRLIGAAMMPSDFDRSVHGLRPVHVQTLGGTIYVCLAKTPPDFADVQRAIEPALALHDLGGAKVAAKSTIVVKGNWKLTMENARECYHCAARHRDLMRVLLDFYDFDDPAVREFGARAAASGLVNGPAHGHGFRMARTPLAKGVKSITRDGEFIGPKVLGRVPSRDIGSLRWQVYPNTFNHVLGDYAFLVRFLPVNARETLITSKFLVPADAVEEVDYNVTRLTEIWLKTNDEDAQLIENNQRGVNSIGYEPGPYSSRAEWTVAEFADWYCTEADRYLSGSDGELSAAAQ
jgi:Rieske 2Fe-2S family protein